MGESALVEQEVAQPRLAGRPDQQLLCDARSRGEAGYVLLGVACVFATWTMGWRRRRPASQMRDSPGKRLSQLREDIPIRRFQEGFGRTGSVCGSVYRQDAKRSTSMSVGCGATVSDRTGRCACTYAKRASCAHAATPCSCTCARARLHAAFGRGGVLLARTCSNPCCTPATIVASADSISCRAEDRASKPRQVTRSTRHTAGAQCNAVAPDDAAAVAMGQRAQMPKQIRIERARLDPPVYDKQTLRVGPSCGLGGHVSRRLG